MRSFVMSIVCGFLHLFAAGHYYAVAGHGRQPRSPTVSSETERSYMQLALAGRYFNFDSLFGGGVDTFAECPGCRVWPIALIQDVSCSSLCRAELNISEDAREGETTPTANDLEREFHVNQISSDNNDDDVPAPKLTFLRGVRSTTATTPSSASVRQTTESAERAKKRRENMLQSINSEKHLWSQLKPYREGTVPDKLTFLPVKTNRTRAKRDACVGCKGTDAHHANHSLDTYFGTLNRSTPLNVDTIPLFYPPPAVPPPRTIPCREPIDLLADTLRTQRGQNPTSPPTPRRAATQLSTCVVICDRAVKTVSKTIYDRVRKLPEKTITFYENDDKASREVLINFKKNDLGEFAYRVDQFLTAAAKFVETSSSPAVRKSVRVIPAVVHTGRFLTFVEYRRQRFVYGKNDSASDVYWTRANEPVNISRIWSENLDDHNVAIHIHGLSPHVTYEMRIALYLELNASSSSSDMPYYKFLGAKNCYRLVETAGEGDPLIAPLVKEVIPTDDDILIRWDVPPSPTVEIKGHILQLYETAAGENSKPMVLHIRNVANATSARFSYLKSNTTYSLRVMAANGLNNSPAYTQAIETLPRTRTEAKEFTTYYMNANALRSLPFSRKAETIDVFNVAYAAQRNLTAPRTLTAATVVKRNSLIYLSDGKTVWARSIDNNNESCTVVVTLREIANTNAARRRAAEINQTSDELDAELLPMYINVTEIDWLNKWLYVAIGRRVFRYNLLHRVSQELVRLNDTAQNDINQLRIDPINGYLFIATVQPALYRTELSEFDSLGENSVVSPSRLVYMGATAAVDIDPRTGYMFYGLFADETMRQTLCSASSLTDDNSRVLRHNRSAPDDLVRYFGDRRKCSRYTRLHTSAVSNLCTYEATRIDTVQRGVVYWDDSFGWLVHGQYISDGMPDEDGRYRTFLDYENFPARHLFLISPKYQPSPRPELPPHTVEALFSADDVRVTWSAPQLLSYQSPAAFQRWSYQIRLECSSCTSGNARTILDETTTVGGEPHWTLSSYVARDREARERSRRSLIDVGGAATALLPYDDYELPALLPGMSYAVHVRAFYEDNYGQEATVYGRVMPNVGALPNLIALQHRHGRPALVRVAPDGIAADDYLFRRAFPTASTHVTLLPTLAQFEIAQILPFQRHLLFTTAGHLFLQELPANASGPVLSPRMVSRENEFNDIWLDSEAGLLYWRDGRSISRAPLAHIVQNRTTTTTRGETLVLGKVSDFLVDNDLMFYTDGNRLICQRLVKGSSPLSTPIKTELANAKKSSSTILGFAVDAAWPRRDTGNSTAGQDLTEKSFVWAETNENATTFYRLPVSILAANMSLTKNFSAEIEVVLTVATDELANTIEIGGDRMQLLGGRLYGYCARGGDDGEGKKLYFIDLFETAQRRRSSNSTTKVELLSGAALYPDEDIWHFVVKSGQQPFPDIGPLLAVTIPEEEEQLIGGGSTAASSSWLAALITLAVLIPVVLVALVALACYNKRRQKAWRKRQVEEITAEVVTKTEEQQRRNVVEAAAAVAAQQQQQQQRYADSSEACSPLGLISPLPTLPLATLRDPHCNVHIQKLLYIGSANLFRDRELGQGHFGSVYRGTVKLNPDRDRAPPIACAVKIIPRHENPHQDDVVLREARSMADLQHHPHIIRLYGVCVEADTISLVMELMDGDVLRWMEKRRAQAKRACELTGKLLCFLRDVADAFACMEEAQFVHRDLAARNCLIKRMNGRPWPVVKVGDFGLARDMYDDGCYVINRERSMPVSVMAPESFANGIFTIATDVWSYGILIYELFTLGARKPYDIELRELKKEIVNNGLQPKLLSWESDGVPVEVCALQAACCRREPQDRPTFALILQIVEKLLRQYMTGNGTPPASATAFSDTNTSASSPRAFFNTSAQLMANVWGDEEDEVAVCVQQSVVVAAATAQRPSAARPQQLPCPSEITSGFATVGRRAGVSRTNNMLYSKYRNSVVAVPSTQQQQSGPITQPSAVPVLLQAPHAAPGGGHSTSVRQLTQQGMADVALRISHNPSYFSTATSNVEQSQPTLPSAPTSTHEFDEVDSPATVTTSFSTSTLPTRGQMQHRRRQQQLPPSTTFVRPAPRPWSPAALAPLLSRQHQPRRSNNTEQLHAVRAPPPESDGRSPTSMDSGPLHMSQTLLPPPPAGAQQLLLQHQPVTPAATPATRNSNSPSSNSSAGNTTFLSGLRRFLPNLSFLTRPSSSSLILPSFILASPPSTTPSGINITTVAAAEQRLSSGSLVNSGSTANHNNGTVRRVQRETSASGPPNLSVNTTNHSGESSHTVIRMNSCFPSQQQQQQQLHHGAPTPLSDDEINSPSCSRASSAQQSREVLLQRNNSTNAERENGVAPNGSVMYFNPTPYRNTVPYSLYDGMPQQAPPPPTARKADERGYYYYYAGNAADDERTAHSAAAAVATIPPPVPSANSMKTFSTRVFHVDASDERLQPLADVAREKARSGGYEEPVIDI